MKPQQTNNPHRYDDMIHLEHHVSLTHPPMSMINRAAQFSPFSALNGYDGAVKETARLTDKRLELDEYEKDLLDQKLQFLQEHLSEKPTVAITYFVPDSQKDGGCYSHVTDTIERIDPYSHMIIMEQGTLIPIQEIISIESASLPEI